MTELKTIVCVDDEPDILELIKLSLETVGNYNVITYPNGLTALSCIQDQDPDLIVIDSMMPDMSGMDLLAKLREVDETKEKPIIFMTARVQPKEQQEYIDLGALAVIPKPFDPMTLSDQIQDIWDKHKENSSQ